MRHKLSKEYLQYTIMVVDDEPGVIESLTVVLGRVGYEVSGETDPEKAIETIRREHFDLLILDFLMTPVHGDRVVELIREFNQGLYILLLTGYKDLAPPMETMRALDIQGYCEKSNRFDQLVLMVESGIKSVTQTEAIRKKNTELQEAYELLEKSYLDTIEALRVIVNTKDLYTRGHSDRVSFYANQIGKAFGLDEHTLEILCVGCRFHDIGKIGTSDAILLKTDILSEEEFDHIKEHPKNGEAILTEISMFREIIPLVKSHHERIDGNGYPDGLSGDEIPFLARIVSVADAFDAMTSTRAYRDEMSLDEAVEQLELGAGTQFDADIVTAFVDILNCNPAALISEARSITNDLKRPEVNFLNHP